MQLEQPRPSLGSPDGLRALLSGCGLRDPERGGRNLAAIAAALPRPGLRDLGPPLARLLPRCPDPDRALNSLERFLAHPAGATASLARRTAGPYRASSSPSASTAATN